MQIPFILFFTSACRAQILMLILRNWYVYTNIPSSFSTLLLPLPFLPTPLLQFLIFKNLFPSIAYYLFTLSFSCRKKHVIFNLVWFISLNMIVKSSIHFPGNEMISLFFLIHIYIHIYFYISMHMYVYTFYAVQFIHIYTDIVICGQDIWSFIYMYLYIYLYL